MDEQFAQHLNCQLGDIQAPEAVPNGFKVTWTATFSRADWQAAGTPQRTTTERISVINSRITEWTSSRTTGAQPSSDSVSQSLGLRRTLQARDAAAEAVSANQPPPDSESLPVSLLAAGALALIGGALGVRGLLRSARRRSPPRPDIPRL